MAYVKIRPRRGTASQWEYANPILSEGEMAFEVPATGVGTGLINIKQGDGQNNWNNLPYAFNGGNLNQKVDDLANTVASYDATIATLTSKVNAMEISVKNIRKIEIQASDPVQEDLILGEIWINTDMVTGSMFITDENGTQITDLSLAVGMTYNIKLVNTISAASIIEWRSTDSDVCSITNQSSAGCTLNANLATEGVTITALAKSDPTTVLMNAKLRVQITVNAGITIIPQTLKLIVGKGFNLGLEKTSSGTEFDRIQWTSTNNSYVTILSYTDNGATIEALKGGQSTIRADGIVKGFPVTHSTCAVTVGGISFAGGIDVVDVAAGSSVTLNLVYTNMIIGEDCDSVAWRSQDDNYAQIAHSDNASAKVDARKAGSVYIIVNAIKDGQSVQEIRCMLNIKGHLVMNPSEFEIDINGRQTVTLINDLGEGNWDEVVWSSTKPEILEYKDRGIDQDGNEYAYFDGITAGEATVVATVYNHGQYVQAANSYGTVRGDFYITVDGARTDDLVLTMGTVDDHATLVAVKEGMPNITAYYWEPGDSSIAAITSGQGTTTLAIAAVSPGTTTITLQGLSAPQGQIIKEVPCTITVEPAP